MTFTADENNDVYSKCNKKE